jgi:hypothetical protein
MIDIIPLASSSQRTAVQIRETPSTQPGVETALRNGHGLRWKISIVNIGKSTPKNFLRRYLDP